MTATRFMPIAPRYGRLALIWLFVVLASLIAPVALRASEEVAEKVTYHRSPPAPKGQPGDTAEEQWAGVDSKNKGLGPPSRSQLIRRDCCVSSLTNVPEPGREYYEYVQTGAGGPSWPEAAELCSGRAPAGRGAHSRGRLLFGRSKSTGTWN